jgi:hypothetical protein
MTNAAQQLLSTFSTLTPQAQQEVLVSLLRLPIEVPYGSPSDESLRYAANAVFLDLDEREALN